MNSVYKDSPAINSLSIPERVAAYKSTSLKLLQQGETEAEFLKAANELVDAEMYEAAQGIRLALKEFKSNPQLSIL